MKNQKEDKPINEVNGGDQLEAYGDEAFNFPSGYRFMPRDQELVVSYLKPKVLNLYLPPNVILEVELYRFNPDQLAELFKPQEENTWYFFTPRDRKYRNGDRPNRAAGDGLNNPPKRERAGIDDMKLDDWVLCRIYKKAGKFSRGSRSSQPREDSDDKIETEESIEEDDTVTTVINPPNSSDVNAYSNLQAIEIPPVNTYQASTFNYDKYMRYCQSPQSMLRDNGTFSAEYEDNNGHFSAQVSNLLLPQEPAIFPHCNNIVYGNCSLQATGMQHFNCCDNVATYSQNYPQSLPAAAVPPPQSHNFHLLGQTSIAPLLQRQLIPVPNSNPRYQNQHPGYYNADFQNPVYQFGVEGSITNPAGSSTPTSQSSVNSVKVEPASASSSQPTKQSAESHMKKNEEHFNPTAANDYIFSPEGLCDH
ncbi:hypothetical protein LWI29_026921 [Acer saccharum]|uniref:NAC domain-containing protein n=1 Tax=Acer saccharum TaxID=4024 RepID=A0AA39REA0_ACESA|nr:hypothetical protein LWI29_026921 [Acer saccharum]